MSSPDRAIPLRRGFVLLALHGQYPLALARAMFERAVAPFYTGDAAALERDLAYLADKKLLSSETEVLLGRTVQTLRLTADGCDVVEGAVSVAGVVIERA